MQRKVDKFIQDVHLVNPGQAEVLLRIRSLFKTAADDLEEEIKYGGLVQIRNGNLIGGIFPYKKHISIEFSHGAEFSDPAGLLEGGGKQRRHLKIQSLQELEEKNAVYFIEQAVNPAKEES